MIDLKAVLWQRECRLNNKPCGVYVCLLVAVVLAFFLLQLQTEI
jgi:hypothetical protein